MASAVARRSPPLRTPGTAGTAASAGTAAASRPPRGGCTDSARAGLSRTGMRPGTLARHATGVWRRIALLAGVDDEAFADQRGERPLGRPGAGWALGDVPDQQA